MDNKTDNMEDICPSAPSYEDAMKCSTVPPVPNESISWQLQQPPMNVRQIQSQPQPIQHQSQLVQHIPAMVRNVRIDGMFPVTCKWCQIPLETRVEHFSTTCTHITYLFIGLIFSMISFGILQFYQSQYRMKFKWFMLACYLLLAPLFYGTKMCREPRVICKSCKNPI